eukprot:1161962-Pelagomonas_calceolata.AAC.7
MQPLTLRLLDAAQVGLLDLAQVGLQALAMRLLDAAQVGSKRCMEFQQRCTRSTQAEIAWQTDLIRSVHAGAGRRMREFAGRNMSVSMECSTFPLLKGLTSAARRVAALMKKMATMASLCPLSTGGSYPSMGFKENTLQPRRGSRQMSRGHQE